MRVQEYRQSKIQKIERFVVDDVVENEILYQRKEIGQWTIPSYLAILQNLGIVTQGQ